MIQIITQKRVLLPLLLFLFATTLLALPEESAPALSDSAAMQADEPQRETIWVFLQKGGSTMFGLALLSTIILAFALERTFYFRRQGLRHKGMFETVRGELAAGGVERLMTRLETDTTLIARVLVAGLVVRHEGRERVEKAIEAAASIELANLEKGLGLLSNIGNLAPLLGFFGTVTGMRHSFLQFVEKAAPTAKDLAGGVEEALITTIVGLFIAIPAYLIHNLFLYVIDSVTVEIERCANELTRSIKE